MSGFFRSLVASDAAPGPRIHPAATLYESIGILTEHELSAAEPQKRAFEIEVPVTPQVEQRTSEVDREIGDATPAPRDTPPTPATPRVRPTADGIDSEIPTPIRQPNAVDPDTIVTQGLRAPSSSAVVAGQPATSHGKETAIRPRSPAMRRSSPATSFTSAHEQRLTIASDQPADVHIHIGRIELTAVTAPEARVRRPSPVKPAMALEEYLERRDRRAR
jgi:hypothetical protein